MNSSQTGPMMSEKELEQLLRDAATPIDFDALIQDGALEKHGSSGWYKILNLEKLPRWVTAQAKQAKSNKKGVFFKFPTSNKRAEKMLRDYETRKKRNSS